MNISTIDMNTMAVAIATGDTLEDTGLPTTKEYKEAFNKIKAEMMKAPGGVMYSPIFDPGEWVYDELIAEGEKWYGENYSNLLKKGSATEPAPEKKTKKKK